MGGTIPGYRNDVLIFYIINFYPYCISILTQIFEDAKSLENLESFISMNGASHYQLPTNSTKIKIINRSFIILLK